jgi:hypothetical protein
MVFRFFSRFKETGGPGCTKRFVESNDAWFVCAAKEMDNRLKGHVSSLESYIEIRRILSGLWPCFALIEFAGQIDLPDEVISHSVIMAIEEATIDFVAWSNVIFHSVIEVGTTDIVLTGYSLL